MTESTLSRLAAFAMWAIEQHRNDGEPGDLDGGSIQDELVRCGLLNEFTVTEPCGEGCHCATYIDGETTCYRLAPDVQEFFDRGAPSITASQE